MIKPPKMFKANHAAISQEALPCRGMNEVQGVNKDSLQLCRPWLKLSEPLVFYLKKGMMNSTCRGCSENQSWR